MQEPHKAKSGATQQDDGAFCALPAANTASLNSRFCRCERGAAVNNTIHLQQPSVQRQVSGSAWLDVSGSGCQDQPVSRAGIGLLACSRREIAGVPCSPDLFEILGVVPRGLASFAMCSRAVLSLQSRLS